MQLLKRVAHHNLNWARGIHPSLPLVRRNVELGDHNRVSRGRVGFAQNEWSKPTIRCIKSRALRWDKHSNSDGIPRWSSARAISCNHQHDSDCQCCSHRSSLSSSPAVPVAVPRSVVPEALPAGSAARVVPVEVAGRAGRAGAGSVPRRSTDHRPGRKR